MPKALWSASPVESISLFAFLTTFLARPPSAIRSSISESGSELDGGLESEELESALCRLFLFLGVICIDPNDRLPFFRRGGDWDDNVFGRGLSLESRISEDPFWAFMFSLSSSSISVYTFFFVDRSKGKDGDGCTGLAGNDSGILVRLSGILDAPDISNFSPLSFLVLSEERMWLRFAVEEDDDDSLSLSRATSFSINGIKRKACE